MLDDARADMKDADIENLRKSCKPRALIQMSKIITKLSRTDG